MSKRILLFLLASSFLAQLNAQRILAEPPVNPGLDQKYLFYLHGRILEEQNPPVHPTFGTYEYDKILDAFKTRGFVVISEIRKKGTEVNEYAKKIAGQVQFLISKGVKPQNITVVGGSKGSIITQWVSTELKNKDVVFSILAGCNAVNQDKYPINLYGKILSVYESTDSLGQSCEYLKNRSTGISGFKEVKVNLGIKHKIVYQPYPEWVEPTIAWANSFSIIDKKNK